MEQNQNNEINQVNELSQLHREILEKYTNSKIEIPSIVETPAILPYNGYYSLNTAPGAFLTIDTNILVIGGIKIYLVYLVVSTNGKESYTAEISGELENNTLKHKVGDMIIEIEFTRINKINEPTVECKGTITTGDVIENIIGYTYNNPIENSLYEGTYYHNISPEGEPPTYKEVLKIGENNSIKYDYALNDGNLKDVDIYVYNMNMYYFTLFALTKNKKTPIAIETLIMGTAADKGFACNNIIIEGKNSKSRSLQTIITHPSKENIKESNLEKTQQQNSKIDNLAAFSGYYPLNEFFSPFSFLSIQAKYLRNNNKGIIKNTYAVDISISFDGVNAKNYYFDETMSFDNNTLKIENLLNLTFDRKYNPTNKSLVTISGEITYENKQHQITAYTPFNPVPLKAFSGTTLTNENKTTPATETLEIQEDGIIKYTNNDNPTISMENYLYVPAMYILANPCKSLVKCTETTTVLSLGTSGKNGTACIIIDVATKKPSFVFAVPNSKAF